MDMIVIVIIASAAGFLYLNIESGNPSDKSLYPPVLDARMNDYGLVPLEIVADGDYASHNNVAQGRENSVDRVVFTKRRGLGFHDMRSR